jgi:hypothetical protein
MRQSSVLTDPYPISQPRLGFLQAINFNQRTTSLLCRGHLVEVGTVLQRAADQISICSSSNRHLFEGERNFPEAQLLQRMILILFQ